MTPLSIITATRNRPALLAQTLYAVRRARFQDVEHVVVSDGPDPTAEYLCRQSPGVRYASIEAAGCWGAAARDAGLALAKGRYVAFWDDDNVYHDTAVGHLRARAISSPDNCLTLFPVWHVRPADGTRVLLPPPHCIPQGGDVDTMCLCVDRTLALRAKWAGPGGRGHDYRWLRQLLPLASQLFWDSNVLGEHIDLYVPEPAP